MRAIIFICLSLIGFNAVSQWYQMGKDIFAWKNDASIDANLGHSIDLNVDGQVMAAGNPGHDGHGWVKVYDYTGHGWSKRGPRIDPVSSTNFGLAVSLSADGNSVAIMSEFVASGTIMFEVYDWTGLDWERRGDSLIDANPAYNYQGKIMELSADGNTLVVRSTEAELPVAEAVLIYDWDGSSWVSRTNGITTPALDNRGYNVSISGDANTIAVATAGTAFEPATATWSAWQVEVFDWDGSEWIARTNYIGETDGWNAGAYISLGIDGNVIAVSSPPYTRIYEWDGLEWNQKSNSITAETYGTGDTSGWTYSNPVDMDWIGEGFVVGMPSNEDTKGQVRAYTWTGTGWMKLGEDITGHEEGDFLGFSVACNGNGTIIAMGAPFSDSSRVDAGFIAVYEYLGASELKEELKSKIQVYPNPSTGQFNLTEEVSRLEVFNVLGEKILIRQDVESFDLSAHPAGIYTVKIDGNRVERIVVE